LYRIHDLFLAMNRSGIVFIAAINGPATGGGCEISLACDIRVMADTEIVIGLPEMTIDFNPGAGGTQRLPRAVGVGRAIGMMLEGRMLSPGDALQAGLVHEVLPPDQLEGAALELGERLARHSPQAGRSLQPPLYEGGTKPLMKGPGREREQVVASPATAAPQE